MSGGGGFYKFRCKYFLSHECPNWVYLNGSACAECAAKGRDLEPAASQAFMMGYLREIYVPLAEGGVVTYTLMEVEVVLPDNDQPYWAVMYRADQQPQAQVPTTTSALPGTPTATTSF